MRINLFYLTVGIVIFFTSCSPLDKKNRDPLSGEALARQYCASCHLYPEPTMLDKIRWERGVLPQMGYRFGIRQFGDRPYAGKSFDEMERLTKANIFPELPIIHPAKWDSLKAFYLRMAPDSLPHPMVNLEALPRLEQFEPISIKADSDLPPLQVLLKYFPEKRQLWMGNMLSRLHVLDSRLQINNLPEVEGPFSDVVLTEDNDIFLLSIGKMDPNDLLNGQMLQLDGEGEWQVRIDSLARPVHVLPHDLNEDGIFDFIICEHGDHLGDLKWYEQTPDGHFLAHTLLNAPGARKSEVHDLNGDGRPDIVALMGQGNEGVFAFTNQGGGRFKQETLLRFSPVYGSSYFEMLDFDRDGDLDILYSNGDNGDKTYVTKPYHGLRIFLNDGKNEFEEAWFFPMNGASQFRSGDFDDDGDLDIAAISFFPDLQQGQLTSFVYLENKNTPDLQFQLHYTEAARAGNWLVMEAGDFDQDGDLDLALGSCIHTPAPLPPDLREEWEAKGADVLLLMNKFGDDR